MFSDKIKPIQIAFRTVACSILYPIYKILALLISILKKSLGTIPKLFIFVDGSEQLKHENRLQAAHAIGDSTWKPFRISASYSSCSIA